jgi:F-box protein, helicase, 18
MNFTPEQDAILSSNGDIKINAVAGSGKTTTLVEYARRQKPGSRILYLAFNRSVRMEAQKKFAAKNLPNIDVQTAHSLAFRRIIIREGYQVSNGYKIPDLVRILDLEHSGGDRHSPFIVAQHIQRYAALFCNGDKEKVTDVDYGATITDTRAAAMVKHCYDLILRGTRLFLARMDRKEIAATHDFYLKKFQLARPLLPYDIILFDEGQDASPVMLDVFLSQGAKKIIVGDIHQQIYGWRQAINALRHVDFPAYPLTTSFRFNRHIAALAMECLGWKRLPGDCAPVAITGMGTNKKIKTRATIARTNLALLKSAIDIIQHRHGVKKIYFEGNISSYTYAADGASIYDVLNLYLENKARIRDPIIASMQGFDDLVEYAENTDDMEIRMLIDIVEEYGKEIPRLLKKLTAMHVKDEDREKADMIFTTLHRSKGMEYDSVTLTDDFVNEARVRRLVEKEKESPIDRNKLNEEINLAYVAVTRSRNFLDFPDEMFPGAEKHLFTSSPKKKIVSLVKKGLNKSWTIGEKRAVHANAYAPWTGAQDRELEELARGNIPIKVMAARFGRNGGAIRARLKKLGEEGF